MLLATPVTVEARTTRWIRSPAVDLCVALAWVPFVVAGVALADRPRDLGLLVEGAFLISFLHQPLTLALVYGDRDRRRLKPVLFAVSPFVFAAAAIVGLDVSLTLVAVVAGGWNALHTLMQRFGLTRMYGRAAGQTDPARARNERRMLQAWLATAVVWAGADVRTPRLMYEVNLGTVNTASVDLLVAVQPWARLALVPVGLAAAVLTAVVVRAEWRDHTANPAKWTYLAATFGLFASMAVWPIAGLAGYIGAHALEYFAVVHWATGPGFAGTRAGLVPALVRSVGPAGFLALYLVAFLGLFAALKVAGSSRLYLLTVLIAGGLHVFYDGFIWKLRRPDLTDRLVSPNAAGVAP